MSEGGLNSKGVAFMTFSAVLTVFGGSKIQGNIPWVAPACADCPRFLVLGSGASDCSAGLHFALRVLGHCLDLLPTAPPPPVQKRDAQHMFSQHRAARAEKYSTMRKLWWV